MRDYNRQRSEKRRALLSIRVRAGSGSERDDERKEVRRTVEPVYTIVERLTQRTGC